MVSDAGYGGLFLVFDAILFSFNTLPNVELISKKIPSYFASCYTAAHSVCDAFDNMAESLCPYANYRFRPADIVSCNPATFMMLGKKMKLHVQ